MSSTNDEALMEDGIKSMEKHDYRKAIDIFNRLLQTRLSTQGNLGCLQVYHRLGLAHLRLAHSQKSISLEYASDLEAAWNMLELARKIAQHLNQKFDEGIILIHISELFDERGEVEKAVTNCQDALHIFENMAVPSYKHMRILHNRLCFRLEYLSRAEEAMIHCKKSIVFGKNQLDQINNRNDSVQSEIELVTIKIEGYKQKIALMDGKHGSSGGSEEELISEPSEIANTVEEATSDPAHNIFSGTTDSVKEAASNPANDIFSGTSEAVKEAHIAADQLMSQGRLAAVQGDYQKTISCYKDALRIRFSLYGKRGCLQAYHDLGRAHLNKYYHDYEEKKNDVENDLDLALEMLNLAREVCHGDEAKKFWEADILLEMIRVLQQKEDFNQVITYCHEALHLLESLVKPDHPKVVDVYPFNPSE